MLIKTKCLNNTIEAPTNTAISLDISSTSTGINILQWNDNKEIVGYAFGIISLSDTSNIQIVQEIIDSEIFTTMLVKLNDAVNNGKHYSLKVERFNQVANSRGNGATEKISIARYLMSLALGEFLGKTWSIWDDLNNVATQSLDAELRKSYDNRNLELKYSQLLKNGKENKKWRRIVATNEFIDGFIDTKFFTQKEKEDLADAFGISLRDYNLWQQR